MNAESLFSAFSLAAIVGWIALIAAPLRRGLLLRSAKTIGVALCIGYLLVFLLNQEDGPPPDFSSLAAVNLGFANPDRLLAGWTHFLAFDLLVGAWQVEEAQRSRIPHLWVVPGLALTFILGPIGLLLFLVVREGVRQSKRTAST